jgi:Zn-dependent protease
MRREKLGFSLAAVFLTICFYYRGGLILLPAMLFPIAAHELSHVLALLALGQKITSLALDVRGLCISYQGGCSSLDHILAALAGPFGGLVYAFFASRIARYPGCNWLEQSAWISFLLSAFNLLPIPPLDGGRAFSGLCTLALGEEYGIRLCERVSSALLCLLLIASVLLMVWKKSTGLLAASIWLLLFQNEEETLVKRKKIL